MLFKNTKRRVSDSTDQRSIASRHLSNKPLINYASNEQVDTYQNVLRFASSNAKSNFESISIFPKNNIQNKDTCTYDEHCTICSDSNHAVQANLKDRQSGDTYKESDRMTQQMIPMYEPKFPESHDTNHKLQSFDILLQDSDEPNEPYLDQTGGAVSPIVTDAGTDAATTMHAVPTGLTQILTPWDPGTDRYGFQLKFQCASSSGHVADLQAQAPNLIWREFVTYSRNDFSHRINPPNPTILPPGGGISFATVRTVVVNPNTLEFIGVTDTHWTPTSVVRADDYALALASPRPLPAIMESSQLYQFSTDGSRWTNFAGPFILKRSLTRDSGILFFTTSKIGIHSKTEDYKP